MTSSAMSVGFFPILLDEHWRGLGYAVCIGERRELVSVLLPSRLLPPMPYKLTLVLRSVNVWGSYILVVPVPFSKQVILV